MLRIGITGQSGFIGKHLFNNISLFPNKYERVPFEGVFFNDERLLKTFVRSCDVIVHLAGVCRHPTPNVVYETNINLVKRLIMAMESEAATPHVLFASSIWEGYDTEYGKSKLEGRKLFEQWAKHNGANFTGMVIPNVYGSLAIPNYVSFIATFCYKLTHNEPPIVLVDNNVKLIYIDNLINHILYKIDEVAGLDVPMAEYDPISPDFTKKVTDILRLLEQFKDSYYNHGIVPALKDSNEINLFNTFCSYID